MQLNALQAEIDRKRKEREALREAVAVTTPATAVGATGKKYVRRGDLQALQSNTSTSHVTNTLTTPALTTNDHQDVDTEQAMKKRKTEDSMTLSSQENDKEGVLLKTESTNHSHATNYTDTTTPTQATTDTKETPISTDSHAGNESEGSEDSDTQHQNTAHPTGTTNASTTHSSSSSKPATTSISSKKKRTISSDAAAYANGVNNYKYVYTYFKGLCNEWVDGLADRPMAERESPEGRTEAHNAKECKSFMRPYFRLAKSRTMPADILKLSVEIVDHCRKRDYHLAGDAYIRLAIGNAAWPIGVSAVGLHERAAREKVGEGRSAHVMNDEGQRKYVTSIKRLISFAQRKYPTDPSRCVYS